MSALRERYNQFILSIESCESFEYIERMAQFSQRRRRGSNPSIYSKASNSSSTSVSSNSSTKSVTPTAVDLDSALYQKGFDLRQFDSIAEFDNILDHGFNSAVGEHMPTLKLTLTPDILRY